MIPKIIHYVWLGGGEKSHLFYRCFESWKKYFPKAEIIEWNENKLKGINNTYFQEALHCKKYAFASDYVRLWVLYRYGGFYLDTDVELTSTVDRFLNMDFVTCYEKGGRYKYPITSAFIAASPKNRIINELLHWYDDAKFIKSGSMDTTPNTVIISNIFYDKFNVPRKQMGVNPFNLSESEIIFHYYYFCGTAPGGHGAVAAAGHGLCRRHGSNHYAVHRRSQRHNRMHP